MILLTGILAAIMALVHIIAGKFRFLDVIPRSRILSAAGGAAVSYVFVHLLPELSQGQSVVTRAAGVPPFFREQHIYLTALFGLVVFYGLERTVKISRQSNADSGGEGTPSPGIFALHLFSFGVYNLIIGYLLVHREVPGLRSLLSFWLAMTLHFVTNDYELRMDFKGLYSSYGRWILAAVILVGWGIGVAWVMGKVFLAFVFAFIAGGVVLNVLRGELPAERQSSFLAFAGGAVIYTALLLLGV